LKAPFPITATDPGTTREPMEFSENAKSSMITTEPGKLTAARLLRQNAWLEIRVNAEENDTDVNKFSANDQLPILVTEFGITAETSEFDEKA
jgi:hypothetical protein